MTNKPERILHEIVHPVDDYEICYMIFAFVENGEVVHTAAVKVESKINFNPFGRSIANIFYTYSIN